MDSGATSPVETGTPTAGSRGSSPDARMPAVPEANPLVVSFVGASGVGKTTVIESLIPLLAERGLRVGTVKHASHGFEVDREGSDSWRHQAAGARMVLLGGAGGAVLFLEGSPQTRTGGSHHHGPSPSADASDLTSLVTAHMGGLDVVLAEGFMPLSDRVVELERQEVPAKVGVSGPAPWIRITDTVPRGPGELGFDEVALLADLIDGELRTMTETEGTS